MAKKQTPAKSQQNAPSQVSTTKKDADLQRDTIVPGEALTTNQGLVLADDQNSLKAGVRGPTLLEDFHFREKITHFDHERIPERVVHARGTAAHGYFECTAPATDITKAGLFSQKGKRTPVFVRFSTVAGSRGSADTPRDVRGFAVKFYTDEGVWDMVGNNIPVFFIQDAIKFPDLIHAVKPEPHNEIPQAASAHDTFWDFIGLTPEAMHMVMWVMSDRSLPRSLASMEGFGIHTFRFINKSGKSVFVKLHFKPVKGVHSLVWDEAQKTAGKDADFHRRDLFESIERGDFPEWEFGVQVVPEEDEEKFDFDLLDPTKLIPEELVPVRVIGKLVLDRNPDNYFAETEQVAFHPGHVVPGIDFSNDPLLQGRLFSYIDTQIKRVGPNFAQLPINRPTCPFSNNQRDGESQQLIPKGRIAYFPNSLASGCPMHQPENVAAFKSYAEQMKGPKVRERSPTFSDHFSQATLFWNSMADWEKAHIVSAISFELNQCEVPHVKQRVLDDLLINVADELARRVAKNIGLRVAGKTKSKPHAETSPALSMDKPLDSIKGRKVAILVGDKTDGASIAKLKSKLAAEGALCDVIAKGKIPPQPNAKNALAIDKPISNAPSIHYDAVYVAAGTGVLVRLSPFVSLLADAYAHGKPIIATGDGVDLLRAANIAVEAESEETGVVAQDASAKAADLLVTAMLQHRFPARQPETMMGGPNP